MSASEVVLDRIERLARISAYPWNLTRRVFTSKQAEAEALVLGWMEEAGLTARRDSAGNLIGRIEGSLPESRAVVIGGFVDTHENSSRYDGTLGVLMGIAAVERVVRTGTSLRHAVEVVAFVEDAAGRFGPRRFGSKAVIGRLDPHVLDWDDAYDVTLRQAMEAHGLDPKRLSTARRSDTAILAYLEVTAEAGPVLEQSGSPIGVVPVLMASLILRVTLKGAAVDAATVPMMFRHDALAGTAECILEAERIGNSQDRATVTVARLDVEPVPNFVVTESVTFGVVIHSADDDGRRAIAAELVAAFNEVAARRQLKIAVDHSVDPHATRCDPRIVRLFERAIEASGHPVLMVPQGMTTDASNMALLGPIGSMLIRCRDGVGWGPAGDVDPVDVEVGLAVLAFVVGALVSGTVAPGAALLDGPDHAV